MRIGVVIVLAAASLAACRRVEYRSARDPGDPQVVALGVRTDPPGATVQVNRIGKTWITPCDIADFSITRGPLDVEISRDGYDVVRTRMSYDGVHPAWLSVKLLRSQAPPQAPPAPEPAKPEVRAPAPAPAVQDPAPSAPATAPVKIEAVTGGTRLKVTSPTAKLRIHARTVISDAERPGEILLPNVPPEKVEVEFLDPKTGAILGSVEFAPVVLETAPEKPPVVKEPPGDVDRVGEVKVVSKTFGVFVKLDPGLSLQPGEEILIYRGGREVARTKILKITKADTIYPDGAAEVRKEGSIQKGDEVRRSKPQ